MKKTLLSLLTIGVLMTPQQSKALDLSEVEQIIEAITSINGELDGIFKKLNLNSIISQVDESNSLLTCLASGIDYKSILPNMNFTDGICKTLNSTSLGLNDNGIDLNEVSKCVGFDFPKLDMNDIAKFCASGNALGGDTFGDDSTTPVTTVGGAFTQPTKLNPKGYTLSPVTTAVTETPVGDAFNLPRNQSKPKDYKDVVYKGGKAEDLYIKDGGLFLKTAIEKPNSEAGVALQNYNLKAEYLIDKNIRANGIASPALKLPNTKGDAEKTVIDSANLVGSTKVDLKGLTDTVAKALRLKFANINAETLDEFEKKEAEEFNKYVNTDKALQALYEVEFKSILTFYSFKKELLAKNSNYISDPSEARASLLVKQAQNDFRFSASLQLSEETVLYAKMLREMKDRKSALDEAVFRGYKKALMWRPDIAKKEIDELLSAVDSFIQ